jgi:hypothetical protein
VAVAYSQAVLEQMYGAGTADNPILGPTRAFYAELSGNAQLAWWENLRARRIPAGIA